MLLSRHNNRFIQKIKTCKHSTKHCSYNNNNNNIDSIENSSNSMYQNPSSEVNSSAINKRYYCLLLAPSFQYSLQESHGLIVYFNCIKDIAVSHFHELIWITRRNITTRFVWDWKTTRKSQILEIPHLQVSPYPFLPKLYGAEHYSRGHWIVSQHFMEPDGSIPNSQQLFLSLARPIQSTSPHPTSPRSILILSTHLCLGLPSGSFPLAFPPIIYKRSPSPHSCYMTRPSHPPRLDYQLFDTKGKIITTHSNIWNVQMRP
jgi:hypothetical protein